MNPEIIEKIEQHYEHAKQKHPYFCDGLLPTQVKDGMMEGAMIDSIAWNIQAARARIKCGIKFGNVLWNEVLDCGEHGDEIDMPLLHWLFAEAKGEAE